MSPYTKAAKKVLPSYSIHVSMKCALEDSTCSFTSCFQKMASPHAPCPVGETSRWFSSPSCFVLLRTKRSGFLETPPAIHCKVSDRSDKTDEFYVCKSRWKNCLGNVSNVRDKRTKMGLSFSVLLVTRGSYDRDTLLLDLYANLINA